MAVKNSNFYSSVLSSAFVPTSSYYTYQHLNANPNARGTYEGWPYTDLPATLQLTHPSTIITTDEVAALQMQHLRFPTPPITPPYSNLAYNGYKLVADGAATNTNSTKKIRRQSVIMKIGQNQLDNCMPPTPEHVDDMSVDIVGLDDAAEAVDALTMSITSTATSSASSSPKRSEYTCEWIDCGRDHNTLEALAAHVTKIHAIASPADGLYYCRWNGCARMRGFSARYKMLVHARTHTKEKPHKCHLCAKSFSRAENLKIHIRSHSGEKPYLCTYEGCHKAYSNSSDRFKHTRTHAMDKPYMCKVPGCQKRYTDPSSLRKHVKTFKHATQLIATAAVTPCKSVLNGDSGSTTTTQPKVQLPTHKSCIIPNLMQRTENVNVSHHLHADVYTKGYSDAALAVCQLCVPAPPPPHYYLNAMEEDICNIKAAQLDYYYATTGHSPTHSNTATSSWSSRAHNDDCADLPMELDTPLDLRVNRS